MSVNQQINPEVQVGVRVKVVNAGYMPDSFLSLPLTLEGKEGTVKYVDRGFVNYVPDAFIEFDDGQELTVELQHLVVVQAKVEDKVSGETSAPKQPRVNYLYVVEDEDGVYLKTFDRDHAREEKAALGGKKAGVIITAYAAVKEIR